MAMLWTDETQPAKREEIKLDPYTDHCAYCIRWAAVKLECNGFTAQTCLRHVKHGWLRIGDLKQGAVPILGEWSPLHPELDLS